MKISFVRTGFAASALALMFAAAVPADVKKLDVDNSKKTVVEVAAGNPTFSTLVKCIETAGLAETLGGEGPYTVFAPTNKAFEKLGSETLKAVLADKEKLTKILQVHVASGKVMAKDAIALDGKMLKTMNGEQKVMVENKKVMIGKSTVTKADIICKNGIIHVIDTVLMPE